MDCFANCSSLREMLLPDTVKVIEQHAFWGCSALDTVTIADGSDRIEKSCLGGCENLKRVIFGEEANPIEDLLYYQKDKRYDEDVIYYVYKGSPAYDNAVLYGITYRMIE